MPQASSLDNTPAAWRALRRLAIIGPIIEIVFLVAWLLIAEAWWSRTGVYLSHREQSRAQNWSLIIACAAYLAVLGPWAIRMERLEARITHRVAKESIFRALWRILLRAGFPFVVIAFLAGAIENLGAWALPLAAVAIWLLSQLSVRRPLRGLFSKPPPLDGTQQRVRALLASVARMGLPDTPVRVTSTLHPGALAACVALRGKRNAIAVSETAFLLLDNQELDAILAHEVAHCRLGHTRLGQLLWAITSMAEVTLLGLLMLQPWSAVPPRGAWSAPDLPRLLLALYLIHLLLRPITAAISRQQERAAGRLALELAGNPRAAISAYNKITRYFGISSDALSWRQRLTATHPSVGELIDQARQFARERGIPLEKSSQPDQPTQ